MYLKNLDVMIVLLDNSFGNSQMQERPRMLSVTYSFNNKQKN